MPPLVCGVLLQTLVVKGDMCLANRPVVLPLGEGAGQCHVLINIKGSTRTPNPIPCLVHLSIFIYKRGNCRTIYNIRYDVGPSIGRDVSTVTRDTTPTTVTTKQYLSFIPSRSLSLTFFVLSASRDKSQRLQIGEEYALFISIMRDDIKMCL